MSNQTFWGLWQVEKELLLGPFRLTLDSSHGIAVNLKGPFSPVVIASMP